MEQLAKEAKEPVRRVVEAGFVEWIRLRGGGCRGVSRGRSLAGGATELVEQLGVAGVASVRQGKVFDIELSGSDKAKAEAALKDAADKLLANTVIENYRVEVLS